MPIRSHLGGQHFDPETIRLMGIAFEMALVSLQRTDGSINPTRAAVAQKIIELAKAGERDPERLCEGALKATQPVIPVLISDPSPLPPHASPPVLRIFELTAAAKSQIRLGSLLAGPFLSGPPPATSSSASHSSPLRISYFACSRRSSRLLLGR